MASRDPRARRLGLRPRFLLAIALLVATTISASLWTVGVLSRLSSVVGETLQANDEATEATAEVASALEREDDALLLGLAGDGAARKALEDQRKDVDRKLEHLDAVLNAPPEQELVDSLRREVEAYRAAADRIADDPATGSLIRYHREANPLLRRAVGHTAQLRERYFQTAERAAVLSRNEAIRARDIVLGISAAAIVVSVLIALHLARLVIVPITEMIKGARAMAHERFEERLNVPRGDELGDLAAAFNEMAEHLADFRRSNLGEVLRAKAALEATMQALPDAVILLDADRKLMSMNQRAQDLLGEAAPGTPASPLEVGGMRLSSLLEQGKSHGGMDLAGAVRAEIGGMPRRLLPRSFEVSGQQEGIHGTILVLYDVTELARLDEMRAELIAVASHELRTPLTTLRMTLLMLQEDADALAPRAKELVTTCSAGAQQLSEIIDEFLDLARIEAGQLHLDLEPLDVRGLLDHAVRRWMPIAGDRDVSILLEAPDAQVIDGDTARLRAVLDNLLSNAMKYVPIGGHVHVACSGIARSDGPPLVRIAVTDDGPGVPEELRERIFEKFFRVEHHRSLFEEGTRGVGIGLYLCRQIIALHRGTIRSEAGDRGRGTRIVIDLPACATRRLSA